MRQLWMHYKLEMLQNRMTCYVHSAIYGSKSVFLERKNIILEWEKIKREMEDIFVEMDNDVISRKKIYLTDRNALHNKTSEPR